jgi:hypothetical protein
MSAAIASVELQQEKVRQLRELLNATSIRLVLHSSAQGQRI